MIEKCSKCLKIPSLCICDSVRPQESAVQVLILQHPQEPDQHLGSALLAHLTLPKSTLKVGLSWPNLKAALGKDVQTSNWAVLYLGSGVKAPKEEIPQKQSNKNKSKKPDQKKVKAPSPSASTASPKGAPAQLQFVSRQGTPVNRPDKIEGLVIIDGTWTQAKALWWRNPWLLKLKRAILHPSHPSLYRELRKETRKECLSTVESIAEALDALGEPATTGIELRNLFQVLLDKQRARLQKKTAARTATARPPLSNLSPEES